MEGKCMEWGRGEGRENGRRAKMRGLLNAVVEEAPTSDLQIWWEQVCGRGKETITGCPSYCGLDSSRFHNNYPSTSPLRWLEPDIKGGRERGWALCFLNFLKNLYSSLFKNYLKKILINLLFLERGNGGRERVRKTWLVASRMLLTRDLALSPGICPDLE